jgi:putative flippase GtrA
VISSKTYIALTKFGVVGGLSFMIDLGIYYSLSQFVPTYIAKATAIVLATMVNYYMNKSWTWGKSDKNRQRLFKYLFLYAISGTINVLANEYFLQTLPQAFLSLDIISATNVTKQLAAVKINKFFAVIIATVFGMIVNFLGQKIWVFKQSSNQD